MKRHDWTAWRRMERCARKGCKALRKWPRRYSTDGGKTWTVARPECTGQPTTDR